ncbi:hypothetical protein E5K00_22075 [Hymenobacter aquaticus]|uniref:Uncharacterized protein n=1 Tax=Hymenobacter aquaticus TaxID=1867101 RepID=A0A4Z0PSN6_9BACT|nr:hypothetical protein [Hymenobacter aquaticus]TGE20678.1 hypothetical protein E5K00_22075 [Hymenobacter aquaticus]
MQLPQQSQVLDAAFQTLQPIQLYYDTCPERADDSPAQIVLHHEMRVMLGAVYRVRMQIHEVMHP